MDRLTGLIPSALARDAGIYFGFRILDKAVPLLILPLVARALGAEQYGIFVLFQALVGIGLPLMTLSVDSSVLLNYFKVSARNFPAYFSSGYLLILGSSLLTAGVVFLVRGGIASVSGFPVGWVMAVVLFCFLQFHTNLALNLFQVRREPTRYGLFSLALTALKNALTLVLVLHYDLGWPGVVTAYTLAHGLFAVGALVMFRRQGLFTVRILRRFFVDNARVGYPLSLHQVGAWASSSVTRVIVAAVLGSASAGSFGVGAAIAMLVMFVQDAFNKAYVPYLFRSLENREPGVERRLVRLTYAYVTGLIALAAVIGVAGTLLVRPVFGAEFAEGREVVLLLCLAYAFNGAYKMHVNYIFYSKRTYLILIITLGTGTLNVGLSLLFIHWYGLVGSALSLAAINFVGWMLAWYVGNRVVPMRWRLAGAMT